PAGRLADRRPDPPTARRSGLDRTEGPRLKFAVEVRARPHPAVGFGGTDQVNELAVDRGRAVEGLREPDDLAVQVVDLGRAPGLQVLPHRRTGERIDSQHLAREPAEQEVRQPQYCGEAVHRYCE